jgi:formylglycine-generating enzyme required for sulfatase activity
LAVPQNKLSNFSFFMKKLFFILILAAAGSTLAWFVFPHVTDAVARAAVGREHKTLAFFPPKIRVWLRHGDADARVLLAECAAADAALAGAREKLSAVTVGDPNFEPLKTEVLKAGVAKLEQVKKVTGAYEKFAVSNPDIVVAPTPFEALLSFDVARLRPWAAALSALLVSGAGMLLAWFAKRWRLKSELPLPPQPRFILLPKGVVLEMLHVPVGSYENTKGEKIPVSEFWLGKYEVTQEQFESVMEDNPSKNKGAKKPVENVTWVDASEFCRRVNKLGNNKIPEDYHFALPTEVQWGYAIRAGGGDGWTKENSEDTTHVHGEKAGNRLGFHDMDGNVAEMCADTAIGAIFGTEGIRTFDIDNRIVMGRTFQDSQSTPIGKRDLINKSSRSPEVGFRLALVSKS